MLRRLPYVMFFGNLTLLSMAEVKRLKVFGTGTKLGNFAFTVSLGPMGLASTRVQVRSTEFSDPM